MEVNSIRGGAEYRVRSWDKTGCGRNSFEISRWKVPVYEIADMVLAGGFFDQSRFGIGSGNLGKSLLEIYRMGFPNTNARPSSLLTAQACNAVRT